MKKNYAFFLFFLLNLSLSLNAANYYVDAARPDDSGDGLSWATAKQTIGAAQSLAVSGDNVYVKAGTYNFTNSTSGTWAFTTVSNVNYYGGFAGTESDPSQRPTSDLDGNGIVESWELSNPTTINFTLTNNASGVSVTANTAFVKFDGFTITGTQTMGTISDASNAGNVVLINGYTLFQNNTISGLTVTGTFNSSGGGSDGLVLRMVAPSTVSNCLFESNSISITGGASQTDVSISPFIRMEQSGGSNRNVFSNSVIRKNQITLDYSAAGLTSNYNTRGIYVAMGIATSAAYTAWNTFKNNIVYNNDATYTAGYNLGQGGLIYTYNAGVASQDSIINNTIAWNNSSRIGRAITIGISSGKYPFHKVLNNVLFRNRNYNGSGTYEQDMACTSAPDNTTAGILIANNITTSGGLTNTTGTNPNIVNNLNDLSTSNTNTTNGAFFTSMSSTYGSTSTGILTSRWTIETGSYLTGKGVSSTDLTDKAGLPYASTPTVGAYETKTTPVITWQQDLTGLFFGGAAVSLNAASNAGLFASPITYTSADPSIVYVSGNTLSIVATSTASTTVTASQAANIYYNAAADVTNNITVTQNIGTELPSISDKIFSVVQSNLVMQITGLIFVFATDGSLITNKMVKSGDNIQLKSGVYVIQFKSSKGSFIKKVVL